eukprot:NODE_1492_length_1317_cov_67.819328_g1479_i0.p1 GENE.NODE_1492_length_1317_cov_67.819328_g1479_i0~~NODE_1492_length_1317_cov_67.819328_g1479_i0.p1  ORF type:complete len:405 (+),score=55.01 NODE_1492_length_1317_cov_67.819328_g1479_i0:60-1274(+)
MCELADFESNDIVGVFDSFMDPLSPTVAGALPDFGEGELVQPVPTFQAPSGEVPNKASITPMTVDCKELKPVVDTSQQLAVPVIAAKEMEPGQINSLITNLQSTIGQLSNAMASAHVPAPRGGSKKRKTVDLEEIQDDEERRRCARRERNKQSAQTSRDRGKQKLALLESSVTLLTNSNHLLQHQLDTSNAETAALKEKLRQAEALLTQHQIPLSVLTQPTPAPPVAAAPALETPPAKRQRTGDCPPGVGAEAAPQPQRGHGVFQMTGVLFACLFAFATFIPTWNLALNDAPPPTAAPSTRRPAGRKLLNVESTTGQLSNVVPVPKGDPASPLATSVSTASLWEADADTELEVDEHLPSEVGYLESCVNLATDDYDEFPQCHALRTLEAHEDSLDDAGEETGLE